MKKILLSTAIFVLSPALALAVVSNPGVGEVPTTEQAVYDTINAAINWLFAILLLAAAVVVILAAYSFLTAAGDPDKTKKARDYITYALIAVLVAFLAKAIVVLVGNMLGVQTGAVIF